MLALMDIDDVPERLRGMGRSQADLARHLSLDPSSLTKTLKGKRKLTAVEAVKIEEFFGEGVSGGSVESLSTRRGKAPRRIPVYGYAAAGGLDRVAYNTGQISDWIDPPPLWAGTGDLIAVRVLGSSMEPRLFEGELVIAQANLPPGRGQDCLIEFNDGSALVKTYQGQKDGRVWAHQWNPDKGVDFDGANVKALHAITWRR